MPVQIGASVPGFSNPTALLSDCHRRIEMFLGSLEAVAKLLDRPLADDARQALDSALRYFREAAPKHTADEEESLFPRLRRVANPEVQAALAELDALEKDHRWAVPLHDEVERLGRQALSRGCLSSAETDVFRSDVEKLAAMYRRHILLEDRVVFPAAARLMPAGEQAAVAREMASRRNVAPALDSPLERPPATQHGK